MRMLTDLERRAFVGSFQEVSTMQAPEAETERELVRLHRGQWKWNVSLQAYELVPTAFGEAALRIDALIRQWGWK